MDSLLEGDVLRTTYEAGRGGSLLVSFHLEYEVVKMWLNLGSDKFLNFWRDRSQRVPPGDVDEALYIANRGGLLPTKKIQYKREGKWPTVVSTETGTFPKEIREFVELAGELFGPLEVIRVIA